MKIKLDENLPNELVRILTLAGHDVHTVQQEGLAGKEDASVFAAAQVEGWLLITQDLDFSDIRQFTPGHHAGILLIRLHSPSRRNLIARVSQVAHDEDMNSWVGCFVAMTDRKLRIRRP